MDIEAQLRSLPFPSMVMVMDHPLLSIAAWEDKGLRGIIVISTPRTMISQDETIRIPIPIPMLILMPMPMLISSIITPTPTGHTLLDTNTVHIHIHIHPPDATVHHHKTPLLPIITEEDPVLPTLRTKVRRLPFGERPTTLPIT
jgi:hypothetical protein